MRPRERGADAKTGEPAKLISDELKDIVFDHLRRNEAVFTVSHPSDPASKHEVLLNREKVKLRQDGKTIHKALYSPLVKAFLDGDDPLLLSVTVDNRIKPSVYRGSCTLPTCFVNILPPHPFTFRIVSSHMCSCVLGWWGSGERGGDSLIMSLSPWIFRKTPVQLE